MKYAIFDFDGTISERGNGWQNIFNYFNDHETDDKFYNMHKRGEISYDQWFNIIVERYKELGLTEKIIKEIALNTKIKKGVDNAFKSLFEQGYRIIILSGGITNIIKHALKDSLKYIHKIEGSDFIFDINGRLSTFLKPKHKDNDKADYIEHLIEKEKLDKNNIIFVGNGDNDEIVARVGIKMLCISPDKTDPNNKEIWNESIDNFEDV